MKKVVLILICGSFLAFGNYAMAQTKNKETSDSSDDGHYKTALGVKFLWGVALTGKHFLTEKHAIEGIVRFRSYQGIGTNINLTALYGYHKNIAEIDGLKWYAGGGLNLGYFSFKKEYTQYFDQYEEITGEKISSKLFIGVVGSIGLEYKISGLPLAASIDWQPVLAVKKSYGGSGLSAENGGIGVKYTF